MGNDVSLGRRISFLFFYCHIQGDATSNLPFLMPRWSHCKVNLIGRALRLLLRHLVRGRALFAL